MKTSSDVRDAELDTLTTLLNGGFIKLYTGSQPASPESAESGTILATLEFGNPAFDPASSGLSISNAITEDSDAAATGTAAWFRCFKSDGVTAILDGTVGTSGADINLNSTSIQIHAQVAISSFSITLPQ
jgi:hypothetical protein